MKPSPEFCEMIKAAYNNEISNVDFYTRMAQLAPNDQVCRAFVQMSRDVLKHSFYLDSICSLTDELVEKANGNSYEYTPVQQMPCVQTPISTYSFGEMQLPVQQIEQAPQMSYDITTPTPMQYTPDMMEMPQQFQQAPTGQYMPQMFATPSQDYTTCPPCNQTLNVYNMPGMSMPGMNMPGMDQSYSTFNVPAPSLPEYVMTPIMSTPVATEPEQTQTTTPCPCQKKVCTQDVEEATLEEDSLSTESASSSPSTIPIPKCCEKPTTTSKENFKNTINSFKSGKRI